MSRPTQPRPGLRGRAALLAGRAAGAMARRLRLGGGTALPGLVAGRIDPHLVELLALQPGRGVVTVTGTNGKTTTTHLLSAIVRAAGWAPLTNRSGSNLERGLVTAYVDEASVAGAIADRAERLGVFEVDEAALPALFSRLRPRVAVFLNLFRDQLDRYGEIDSVAAGWRRLIEEPGETVLALNADDPSVAGLARPDRRAVTFGVEDATLAVEAEHATDARFCECGEAFAYDAVYLGQLGRWRCPRGHRQRPIPEVAATQVQFAEDTSEVTVRVDAAEHRLTLPITGLSAVYNALASWAAARALGVPSEVIVEALGAAGPAFGRQERFEVEGRHVRVLLAKNPAGLNEVVRTFAAGATPLSLLAMLNDGIQDGADVSWIYDADLERLRGKVASLVCSGTRAEDLALRLSLAGVEPEVIDRGTVRALEVALARTPVRGRLDVVATYTAMLEVREEIASRAGRPAYWRRP